LKKEGETEDETEDETEGFEEVFVAEEKKLTLNKKQQNITTLRPVNATIQRCDKPILVKQQKPLWH